MLEEMIYMFSAYITDIVKLWLFLWGIMKLQPLHKKRIYYHVSILQVVFFFVTGIFIEYSNEVMLFRILVAILSIVFLFEGNYFKKLSYSLLAYLLILILDGSTIEIFNIVMEAMNITIRNDNILKYVYNIVNIFTIGSVALIRSRKKTSGSIHISKKIYALLFAGTTIGVITLAALSVSSNDKIHDGARKLILVATIIVIIVYTIICFMIVYVTESRDNYKALSVINQNVIESQQQYYSLVNEKQQEMRSIRHEMRNHLACINSLYQAGKLKEMDQYINQLVETAATTDDLFHTGNDIVDAILNDAQSKYSNDNIIIRLQGGFQKDTMIDPMDLCVIFANLVSNAIEAILRIDKEQSEVAYIDIEIKSYKDDLFINVSNPVDLAVVMKDGKMITSKPDKDRHGFGVKNIKQRVEKYQGEAIFRNENNQFFVEINMKNRV